MRIGTLRFVSGSVTISYSYNLLLKQKQHVELNNIRWKFGRPKIQKFKIQDSPELRVVKRSSVLMSATAVQPQFKRLRLRQREQESIEDGGLGPRCVLLGPKHGRGTRSERAYQAVAAL